MNTAPSTPEIPPEPLDEQRPTDDTGEPDAAELEAATGEPDLGERPDSPDPALEQDQSAPADEPVTDQPAALLLPSVNRLALDLALGPNFRGKTFAEATWNWPAAVRAAILLIDQRDADPKTPLLPGKVMLDESGALLVRPVDSADATLFLAPELAQGQPADQRTAVYHIAALTYALLLGYPPIGDISSLGRLAPDVPARLREALLQGMAIDPDQRTATPAELRAQLLFVLVPPVWYEEIVPRLPLADETKTTLVATLDRGQSSWLRLRDRIPWQRLGRGHRRLEDLASRPRIRRSLMMGGGFLALLIYLLLLTDLL